MTVKRVSFWNNENVHISEEGLVSVIHKEYENVLKLIVVVVAQFSEH